MMRPTFVLPAALGKPRSTSGQRCHTTRLQLARMRMVKNLLCLASLLAVHLMLAGQPSTKVATSVQVPGPIAKAVDLVPELKKTLPLTKETLPQWNAALTGISDVMHRWNPSVPEQAIRNSLLAGLKKRGPVDLPLAGLELSDAALRSGKPEYARALAPFIGAVNPSLGKW